MEVDKFNAAGGLGGRKIEIVTRDSKGKPDEAANNTRQLINSDGCEIIINAESSAGAFAVQEVIRELKVLCIHTNSETSSLSADPKIRVPTAFRTARQGIHDAIVSAAYAGNVAKAKGLKTWMSCSPDYAYGRDNTSLFLEYLKRFHPGDRGGRRGLAQAVPGRLHREHHQDPADQAAGALLRAVGRRPGLVRRPVEHLQPVRADPTCSRSTWPTTPR